MSELDALKLARSLLDEAMEATLSASGLGTDSPAYENIRISHLNALEKLSALIKKREA